MELRCEECDAVADGFEPGWSAFYVQDPEEDPEPFLVTYCATCAEREFSGWLRRLSSARRSRPTY